MESYWETILMLFLFERLNHLIANLPGMILAWYQIFYFCVDPEPTLEYRNGILYIHYRVEPLRKGHPLFKRYASNTLLTH
jgi:hypothetical protein